MIGTTRIVLKTLYNLTTLVMTLVITIQTVKVDYSF